MVKKKPSELEERLALQIRAIKLPPVAREYRFAAEHVGPGKGVRKRLADAGLKNWRFDFAFVEIKLAVECEGGGWSKKGGHTTGEGFADDLRKYGAAMELNWRVYRCDLAMIRSGEAINAILRLLELSQEGK